MQYLKQYVSVLRGFTTFVNFLGRGMYPATLRGLFLLTLTSNFETFTMLQPDSFISQSSFSLRSFWNMSEQNCSMSEAWKRGLFMVLNFLNMPHPHYFWIHILTGFIFKLLCIFNASSNKCTRLLKMNVKNRGIVNLREKFFFNSNVRSRRLKADSVSTNSAVSLTDDDDWKVSGGDKSATSAELEAAMFTSPHGKDVVRGDDLPTNS